MKPLAAIVRAASLHIRGQSRKRLSSARPAICLTRLAVSLLVALAAVLSAAGQPAPAVWRTVTVGVEHAQFVRNADAAGAPGGSWSINALRIDLLHVRLDVVHALDEAVGLETVSSIAQRHRALAAINGGYFRTAGTFRGDSTGTLQIDGSLLSEPDRARAAVGFVRNDKLPQPEKGAAPGQTTRLIFGHVTWEGIVTTGGRSRPLDGINRPRGHNEVILFTPEFHQTTLTDPTGTEVVVRAGRVDQIREGAGSTPIPADGFVLSATGAARHWVRAELGPGHARVSVSLSLKPADPSPSNPWTAAEDILGAGPKLVTGGRVDITAERETMRPGFATERHPRSAIASLADGRALLLVVDGRQPLSIGMSLDELARLLIDFGAIEGMNLDGGGSTAMVVQGKVVNHPSDTTGERPVSDAILVLPRTAGAPNASRRLP